MDERYLEHMMVAARFGATLIWAGFACLIHAVIPGFFLTTGSDVVRKLHADMVKDRHRSGRSGDTGNTRLP